MLVISVRKISQYYMGRNEFGNITVQLSKQSNKLLQLRIIKSARQSRVQNVRNVRKEW